MRLDQPSDLSLQIWKNRFAGSVPQGVLAQVAEPSRLISVGEIEARQSVPMSVVVAIKAISSNNTRAYWRPLPTIVEPSGSRCRSRRRSKASTRVRGTC